jgi:hypothetical protein
LKEFNGEEEGMIIFFKNLVHVNAIRFGFWSYPKRVLDLSIILGVLVVK